MARMDGSDNPEYLRLERAYRAAEQALHDIEDDIVRIQDEEREYRRQERQLREQLNSPNISDTQRQEARDQRYLLKCRIADLASELQEAHNEVHALRNNRDRAQAALEQSQL
ncbi:hypothetical protein GSS88_11790 [Corynebacterium sp. 3HC-13]|uniref:hypothetical protein n=1 Tax=Corynebacterium poyangense TaxID=2684405 RepID=UPI001CCA231F|nr:hypothetical protein [Corynebacterium poyangense]MBZ8178458.1 hypothetical protein [Corynebacterium poyangense]